MAPRRSLFSIGLKLFVGVTTIVALASTALFYWLITRERASLIDAKREAGAMVADVLATGLVAPLDFEDEDALKRELDNVRVDRDVVYVAVLDPEGKRLAQVGEREAPAFVEGARELVTAGEIQIDRPIKKPDGTALGQAVLVLSLDAVEARMAERRATLLRACGLLGLATALVLALLVERGVVAPIRRLSEAARRIEGGEAGVRVAVGSRDEVGVLAGAFNAMSEAVRDREQRLDEARARVQDLLDHMRQAIVVFDKDGVTSAGASRTALTLFGRQGELGGVPIAELLYPGEDAWRVERVAFQSFVDLLADADADAFADLLALAPPEVELVVAGEPRTLELEFVALGDPPHEVMMLAEDVTEARALARARERAGRENEALRRMLGSGHLVRAFVDGARERILRCRELHAEARADASVRAELFQHVHTIKGEALTFDLDEVAGSARDLEAALAAGVTPGVERLRELLDRLAAALDRAERRFVELAPEGELTLSRVPVDRRAIAQLEELTRQGERPDADAWARIGALAQRIAARPFGELVATLSTKVPGWAASVGKSARLEIEGRETPVPSRLASVLPGVLIHLVRNAIAHGIEAPEERERAGKPAQGLIVVRCAPSGSGAWPRISVLDDGRGFATKDQAERAFTPGYSTAAPESELAGLGVGLTAVREELRAAGYAVAIERGSSEEAQGGASFILDRLPSS